MNVGITILVMMVSTLVGQVFMLRREQQRRHEEIMRRLDAMAPGSEG
jgi:preprotein translocase subunit YajC